ncbi:MAG: hypothetical protein ORN83_05465 [Chthoniobacteraceae bacterium]|nr:hypothetical protein [Chthoniobacteraceae bacterium]
MRHTYTPPAEQDQQRISVGIYNAECLSVTDGTSGNGNPQVDLECQVETMKLRFRLIFKDTVAWKLKQTRRAFGFVDPEGLAVSFDTAEFVGKSALCLVGYGEKLAKSGNPYLELVEFVEAGKETAAEIKLTQIIAGENARKAGTELDHADSIPF